MARPDSWMPIYWGDFWKDTTHLSEVEGWAYLNLIGAYWTNGGPLANDDARLQRLSKCSPRNWKSVRATVTAFFAVDSHCLRHSRIDHELAEATKTYNARRAHIDKVNEDRRQKREQSPSTVTETVTVTQSQSQPHSPNGEHPPSEDGAKRPRQPKGTRLEADWKPCQAIFDHGASLNLTRDETGAICRAFKEYFLSPDASKPVKKDWDGACKRWITRDAPRVVASRNRGKRPNGNDGVRQSLTAATNSILAKAGIRPEPDEQRAGEVRAYGSGGAEGIADCAGNSGPIIDADEWSRVPESSQGNEGHDPAHTGHDGRLGNRLGGLPQAADGIPSGRGEEGADDASRDEPLVAIVGGTEGPARSVYASAPDDADGLAVPQFLKRA